MKLILAVILAASAWGQVTLAPGVSVGPGVMIPATAASADCTPAQGSSYDYCRTITIDSSQVGSTDRTNYTAKVFGTLSYLATVANGGRVQDTQGDDIGFYGDSGCVTTKLNWATELWTDTTGAVSYKVLLSSVSHTANTVFYLCYGSSTITTDQSNPTAAYSSDYKGVWPLGNGTTLSVADISGNANNGTLQGSPNPSATTGQVDGGMANSGTGRVSVGTSATLIPDRNFTIVAWVNGSDFSTERGIFTGGQGSAYLRVSGAKLNFLRAATVDILTGNTTLSTATWYHVAVTVSNDATATVTLYLNGASDGSTTTTQNFNTSTIARTIGSDRQSGNEVVEHWQGTIDELRFVAVALSGDDILADYNNTKSSQTFFAIGAEVAL